MCFPKMRSFLPSRLRLPHEILAFCNAAVTSSLDRSTHLLPSCRADIVLRAPIHALGRIGRPRLTAKTTLDGFRFGACIPRNFSGLQPQANRQSACLRIESSRIESRTHRQHAYSNRVFTIPHHPAHGYTPGFGEGDCHSSIR